MPWMTSRLRRAGVLIVFYGLAQLASAQWVWRDDRGRPVYSDIPPPPGIKPGDILQRPTAAPPPAATPSDSPEATAPAAPSSPAPAAAAPHVPTMAEREQEFRKRMKAQAEAEKKQADNQAVAARNAEDCDRARGYLKSLDDGMRLIRTTPDGSREPMDESQRAAEAERSRAIIASRCK